MKMNKNVWITRTNELQLHLSLFVCLLVCYFASVALADSPDTYSLADSWLPWTIKYSSVERRAGSYRFSAWPLDESAAAWNRYCGHGLDHTSRQMNHLSNTNTAAQKKVLLIFHLLVKVIRAYGSKKKNGSMCVNSVSGGKLLAKAGAALFSGALCFCLLVQIKRLRTSFLAWLCLQKGNQAWCPKPVSGANRIWANIRFVRVRARTDTRTLGHTKRARTHWHAQAHMMQTNKQTKRHPGFLCLYLFVAKKTRGDIRHFLTEHHRLSGVKIQLAYSSFSSFERAATAPCMKASWIKGRLSASPIQA